MNREFFILNSENNIEYRLTVKRRKDRTIKYTLRYGTSFIESLWGKKVMTLIDDGNGEVIIESFQDTMAPKATGIMVMGICEAETLRIILNVMNNRIDSIPSDIYAMEYTKIGDNVKV